MSRLPGSGNYLVDMWEETERRWCPDCGCTTCRCDDLTDEEILKRKGLAE